MDQHEQHGVGDDPDKLKMGSAEVYQRLKTDNPPSTEESQAELGDNPILAFNLNQTTYNPDFVPAVGHENGHGQLLADQPTSPELAAELEQTHWLTDPETGQQFSCLKLNWPPSSGGRPHVVFQGMMGSTAEDLGRHAAAQFAKQLGGPVMVLNRYGMAGSDIMSEADQEAALQGNFRPQLDVLTRALVADGETKITASGHSMGGRELAAFIAVAPEHGLQIDEAVIVVGPGAAALGVEDLRHRFIRPGGKARRFYAALAVDPEHKKVLAKTADQRRTEAAATPQFRHSGHEANAAGMAYDTMGADLLDGLAANPSLHITLVSGSEDEVVPQRSYRDMIRNVVGALAINEASGPDSKGTELVEDYQKLQSASKQELNQLASNTDNRLAAAIVATRNRIQQVILPGDAHPFASDRRRMVAFVADAVKASRQS